MSKTVDAYGCPSRNRMMRRSAHQPGSQPGHKAPGRRTSFLDLFSCPRLFTPSIHFAAYKSFGHQAVMRHMRGAMDTYYPTLSSSGLPSKTFSGLNPSRQSEWRHREIPSDGYVRRTRITDGVCGGRGARRYAIGWRTGERDPHLVVSPPLFVGSSPSFWRVEMRNHQMDVDASIAALRAARFLMSWSGSHKI
jgi:hypothetical protein